MTEHETPAGDPGSAPAPTDERSPVQAAAGSRPAVGRAGVRGLATPDDGVAGTRYRATAPAVPAGQSPFATAPARVDPTSAGSAPGTGTAGGVGFPGSGSPALRSQHEPLSGCPG